MQTALRSFISSFTETGEKKYILNTSGQQLWVENI